jgi:hypothetical protein
MIIPIQDITAITHIPLMIFNFEFAVIKEGIFTKKDRLNVGLFVKIPSEPRSYSEGIVIPKRVLIQI